MVNNEVFRLDGSETIAAIVAHALRKARIVCLELEIGAVHADDFGKFIEGKHAVVDENFILA